MSEKATEVSRTFRALVESAERKFGRVRDVAAYGRVREFEKVFKAYMRLWKFQQEHRSALVGAGLNRWEIGEIASRIGQLYFGHYMRTSESRFLVESCVFYNAILTRSYFQASILSVRFKELRFLARFLQVAFLLRRTDLVELLLHRLRAVVEESTATFRDTNFKEWRQVIEEGSRFMKAEGGARALRYCPNPRLDANKLKHAVLSSYHRNEVKFAELTLDTFRMMQCLEWDHNPNDKEALHFHSNGKEDFHSGVMDINDLPDPSLPPNPRKALLYRPSVTRFIAVMATICDELPPDSVLLVYLSASGNVTPSDSHKLPKNKTHDFNNALPDVAGDSSDRLYDRYLWFGPRGHAGSNNLYPGDFVPFTRRPLFLIVDSDTSHAFKALHGAERGEPAALLLSHLRPAFKKPSDVDTSLNGSQFTFFLTAPLAAFCQLVGLSCSGAEADVYNDAEDILSTAFSEWELILCTSTCLDSVWGQLLPDPFLRRLILRFIFCRSVLYLLEGCKHHLPTCLPPLPKSVAPDSQPVKAAVLRLAKHLRVSDSFHADHTDD